MLFLGVSFFLAGGFLIILPFLGWTSDNGEPVPKWASIIGLVFAAVGIVAVLYAKKKVITLLKNGESNITETRIIGGGVQSQSFQVSDVVAVNLSTRNEYVSSSDGNRSGGGMQRISDLHLLLNNNSTIEITSSSGQGGLSLNGINMTSLIKKAPLANEAEQIAGFLGVPIKYEDSSSLQGLKDMIMGKDASQPPTTTPPLGPHPLPTDSSASPPDKLDQQ